MNKLNILTLFTTCLGLVAALGCDDVAPPPPGPGIEALWYGQSTGQCTAPARGVPEGLQRIVIEQRDAAGNWEILEVVSTADADPDGTLVEGIPTGELLDLRLVACDAAGPIAVARPLPFTLGQDDKVATTAHFRPVGALSCAGTGQGPEYDRFSARAMAFGAALPFADRVLLIGGADTVAGGRLTASEAHAWSVFDWHEGLFWPGVERAQPLEGRTLAAPRIMVGGGATTVDGVDGLVIFGGSPAVLLQSDPLIGPLLPEAPDPASPSAVFFDPATGGQRPLIFEPPLVPRTLAGIDAGDGWIVRAGGLAHGDEDSLSRSAIVEAIQGRQAIELSLGAPLIGASVTALGAGDFLVWGADVAGCGAQAGFIVRPTDARVTPVTLPDAPGCGAAANRTWWATGFHTATRLPYVDADARVLITGGLPVRESALQPNPDPGVTAAANAFVLKLNPTTGAATAEPVIIADDAADRAIRRAFHRAVEIVRGEVILSGGWGSFGKPTSFVAGDALLHYDDALPAGRLTVRARLTEARFGHVMAALPEGRALIAGGLAPASVELVDGVARTVGELTIRDSAEIWTPPLTDDPCARAAALEADMGPPPDAGIDAGPAP